jgi:hypothetical protein
MMRLLRLDAIQLLRDRLALGVVVVGLLSALLVVATGSAWRSHLDAQSDLSSREAADALAAERVRWAEANTLEPAEAALLPTRLFMPIRLTAPTLPDFSTGRSALEPVATSVRLSTRPDAMFTRYQVANAERLARGGLDLAFVVVVIAPLLLIGIGYGLFVADREAGTARLWLTQAGSPLGLIAARSINRIALVFAPILLAGTALLLFGPDIGARAEAVASWLLVALLGLMFWWAVILVVNSFKITAETAALTLVALWTLLVFVMPVAIQAAATVIDPPPSRFEQIAVARAAEVASNRSYEDDHPELSSNTLEGRRASVEKGIAIRTAVAQALAPLHRAHKASMDRQRLFANRLALLSPPVLTADALAGIARTDVVFYERQREAAQAYLALLSQATAETALGQRPIDAAAFDALPRFEPPAAPPLRWTPVLWLAALTGALGAWALLRLRRASPI